MEWSGVGSRSRELRLRLGVPHAARVRLVTYAPKATLWMEHGDRDPTPQHTDRNSRQFLNGRHSKVFFSRCCKIAKPTQHRLGRFLKLWLCDGSKASQGQNYLGWTRPHHLPRSWCLRLDQSSQEGTRRLQAPCQPAFGHHCSPSRRPVIPWRIWQTVHSKLLQHHPGVWITCDEVGVNFRLPPLALSRRLRDSQQITSAFGVLETSSAMVSVVVSRDCIWSLLAVTCLLLWFASSCVVAVLIVLNRERLQSTSALSDREDMFAAPPMFWGRLSLPMGERVPLPAVVVSAEE